ncbi:MAG: hypothetical protein GX610_24865, partial [Rhodococcus sp.]|nr:hypothetical protein [Rhodococcus sp. (in: high G+C Gram-positive bacteria)]
MTIDLHGTVRLSRSLITLASAATVAVLAAGCLPSPADDRVPDRSATVTRPAAPEGTLPDPLRTALQGALDRTMTEYGVPGAAVGV